MYKNSENTEEATPDIHEPDSGSTWNNRYTDNMISPSILQRYLKFHKLIAVVQKSLITLLILALLGCFIKLFFTDFEVLIFDDGTDLTCIYNLESGAIELDGK